ncbi:hypothetical protein T484DRAFT_1834403 [Baffinella frigidus]|nr:hypothetical protein T484DRAFT_1834403 [Cryptophyta sp. CCMP2293]
MQARPLGKGSCRRPPPPLFLLRAALIVSLAAAFATASPSASSPTLLGGYDSSPSPPAITKPKRCVSRTRLASSLAELLLSQTANRHQLFVLPSAVNLCVPWHKKTLPEGTGARVPGAPSLSLPAVSGNGAAATALHHPPLALAQRLGESESVLLSCAPHQTRTVAILASVSPSSPLHTTRPNLVLHSRTPPCPSPCPSSQDIAPAGGARHTSRVGGGDAMEGPPSWRGVAPEYSRVSPPGKVPLPLRTPKP